MLRRNNGYRITNKVCASHPLTLTLVRTSYTQSSERTISNTWYCCSSYLYFFPRTYSTEIKHRNTLPSIVQRYIQMTALTFFFFTFFFFVTFCLSMDLFYATAMDRFSASTIDMVKYGDFFCRVLFLFMELICSGVHLELNI